MEPSLLEILWIVAIGPFATLIGLLWHSRGYHCPECGRRAEDDAAICPHCGNDLTVGFPG